MVKTRGQLQREADDEVDVDQLQRDADAEVDADELPRDADTEADVDQLLRDGQEIPWAASVLMDIFNHDHRATNEVGHAIPSVLVSSTDCYCSLTSKIQQSINLKPTQKVMSARNQLLSHSPMPTSTRLQLPHSRTHNQMPIRTARCLCIPKAGSGHNRSPTPCGTTCRQTTKVELG